MEDRLGQLLSDPAGMARLFSVADKFSAPEDAGSREEALLSALLPYAGPERKAALEKAMRIARLTRLICAALPETEGPPRV